MAIDIKEWTWEAVKKKDAPSKTIACPYCNVTVKATSNTRIVDVATGAIKYHIHKCPECFMPVIIGLDGKIIPQSQLLPFEDVRFLPTSIEKLYNDGSPMYKSAFTKTQKRALKQLHQLIDLYRDVDLTEDCRMTLGEWLDKWLDEYMIFTIRESTLDSYRAMVKNQVKPFIGGKQIASLTTADMQKFYNKIKKEGRVREHPIHGKTLADSMVRGVHVMLHEALDTAVKERLIAKNPTNGTTVPKCNYPEKQILGDNQLETFLEAIKGHEYWCDFFYVEVMTGLRRGEICGLRWQDINFEENKLQVKRSVSVKKGGGVSIGETKTETGVRCIQMPPSVAELLKSKKQTAITEWVFPHFQHPEQPISPASAYRKLKVMLKNAELPLIRFHDLRHTFATHATQGGVDPKTLAGILGHTNASFTLDTYTHVTSDMQKSASLVVGNMIKNIMIKE